MREIPSTWMRGGTSKCWVFDRDDLDIPGRGTDEVLLRLYGSPDPRQLDGVGGASSTTSKAVILSRSARADADVDYTFAQVAVDERRVDWGSNCGNCAAVVGPWSVRRGWVAAAEGTTAVRVHNTNTGQSILLEVPTPGGVLQENGDAVIPGVVFPGSAVRLWFVEPAGRTTGALFPTGRPAQALSGGVSATLIDAAAPVVIVPAAEVGLSGGETAAELDARPDLLRGLDELRREAAVRMGLAEAPESAQRAVPKLALVAPPPAGRGADLTVRMLSMGRAHPALAMTGSIALTEAARSPGTVVHALVGDGPGRCLRLLSPAGVIETRTRLVDGRPAVGVLRTARRIADATLTLPGRPAAVHAGEAFARLAG
ncbi:PrpF domain-containing protein [Pseudonocardia acaciae]|uniref:PrpF domain-containing protein n=1 Tax=Pseudonocardia acaciae TaxID=551276 RepID=UPI0004902DEE|nr:PrpF domain-containing protein [Pseudonocardia acaciae]